MFTSAICSGVKCHANVLLDVEEVAKFLHIMGDKLWVVVGDDFPWYTKPRDEVVKIEGDNTLSDDICGIGDEFGYL